MLSHMGQLLASGSPSLLTRCIATSAARRSLAAVEKLYKELEGKKALPWENPVTYEEAAQVLGGAACKCRA